MDWDCEKLASEYEKAGRSEMAGFWRELSEKRQIEGLSRYDDGYKLNTGKISLFFRDHEIPGLSYMADRHNPRIWADSDYKWNLSVSEPDRPEIVTACNRPTDVRVHAEQHKAGGWDVTVIGRMMDCIVKISYHIPADGSYIDEHISIRNVGESPLRLVGWDFGPARRIGYQWFHNRPADLETFRAYAVPWYRTIPGSPEGIQDFDIDKICHIQGNAGATGPSSCGLPSEAWGLSQDGAGMLVLKYAREHIEYSVLRNETRDLPPEEHAAWVRSEGRFEHLIFGGSTRYRDDPDPDDMPAGASFNAGLTRYSIYYGNVGNAFTEFHDFMDRSGHALNPSFNPSVHWNELYDVKYDFFEKDPEIYHEKQKQLYNLMVVEHEARKAVRYRCEALYLDPGWDTAFGSSVWDTGRFGDLPDFVRRMKAENNLNVALHITLAGWCDPSTYPESAMLIDINGHVHEGHLCSGAADYLRVKAQRLKALASAGVSFLMFDGTYYTGACYDRSHGHPIPYTRDAHMMNCLWLAKQVREANPEISIEMHDFVVSGIDRPYCPVYLGHGNDGFDEAWGWEMMHDPMADLASGRALALYWYNLAYSIPVYLHINLKRENKNCLMFWWFASTCRHLGFGGTNSDPAVEDALIEAMETYRRYKRYYTNGSFVGLDETSHLHTLPGVNGGALNLFNLTDEETMVSCRIQAKDLDMAPGCTLEPIDSAEAKWDGDELLIRCRLKAMSPKVMMIMKDRSDE